MTIDPYCQQKKCSPGIGVSTEVRFMPIFPGVRWGGASNESGVGFFDDFRRICRNISKTVHFRHKATIGRKLSNGVTFDALE